MKIILTLTVLGALAACSTTPPEAKEPPLDGTLTLSAGPCPGFCPVYKMRVDPEDRYRLTAGENTAKPGNHKGALPVGSFRRAVEALERYDFASLRDAYTPDDPDVCAERVTGTPEIEIARRSETFRKAVTYDTGCLGFEEKDRLDQLTSALREIFRVDALIVVGQPKKRPTRKNETIGENISAGEDGA